MPSMYKVTIAKVIPAHFLSVLATIPAFKGLTGSGQLHLRGLRGVRPGARVHITDSTYRRLQTALATAEKFRLLTVEPVVGEAPAPNVLELPVEEVIQSLEALADATIGEPAAEEPPEDRPPVEEEPV